MYDLNLPDLNLPLFPSNASAITVTTTVWIGVWVVSTFNLRFGWTLSGLVVPGYLTPLLIAKPMAAVVIVGEAILTYLVVHAISERPRFFPYWCSFFGRDRFFALVLVSVLVRALGDGWLLPWLGQWLDAQFQITLDYRNDFHSYGLIIVSLIANYLWKPGLRRGILPMLTTIGLTFLIVRFGLVELTNFNIGGLQHTYEDMSTSLLASPKAYVIVITTAYIASRMNLRYSWEFNGILIPALMGLLWHDPWKIATSFIEGALVLAAASALLRSPVFRGATMEGARKLMLFFTICFAYRLALAHVLPITFPNFHVTDAFGFGYLLSTLMAVKAHEKKLAIRIFRATAQVSILGSVVGSLIGYLLCGAPTDLLRLSSQLPEIRGEWPIQRTNSSLASLVRRDKVLLYQMRVGDGYLQPLLAELTCFRQSMACLQRFAARRDPAELEQARRGLAAINYEIVCVQDRYIYLRERSPARGWGIFAISLEQRGGICVAAPAPLDERLTAEAGVCLFERLGGRGLAIAGADRRTLDGAADVLTARDTIFQEFYRAMGRRDTLLVRGHTRHLLRERQGRGVDVSTLATINSQLWAPSSLSTALPLRSLKDLLLKDLDIRWRDTPFQNALGGHDGRGIVELVLNRRDRLRLSCPRGVDPAADPHDAVEMAEGYLHEWLLESKQDIARRGSGAYLPPRLEELLYLDEEVLRPLLHVIARTRPPHLTASPDLAPPDLAPPDLASPDERDLAEQLRSIDAAARALNYRLVLFRDRGRRQTFAVLRELAGQPKHWGTYVFRWSLAEPLMIEVPRPLYEQNAFEFGLSLFDRGEASALLVAGANPLANRDGGADVARLFNKQNVFNLVHQVLLREIGQRPMLVVQSRAIRAPTVADIVVALDDGLADREHLSPLKTRLIEMLEDDGLRVALLNGEPGTAGYEVGFFLRGSAMRKSENTEVASLWLAPSLKTSLQVQADNRLLWSQFAAAGIPTAHSALVEYLQRLQAAPAKQPAPQALKEGLLKYLANYDIVWLGELQRRFAAWRWMHLVDRQSGQAYLLIAPDEATLPFVVNLAGAPNGKAKSVRVDEFSLPAVVEFVAARATWLEFCKRNVEQTEP